MEKVLSQQFVLNRNGIKKKIRFYKQILGAGKKEGGLLFKLQEESEIIKGKGKRKLYMLN